MIDMLINGLMLLGIAVVSVPVLFFAVTGIVHMAYGAYTLYTDS
jgi:hypothetical protein